MLYIFIKHAAMKNCKPVSTPLSISQNLRNGEYNPLSSSTTTSFRSIFGALDLTNTRPDLTFSINLLTQFMYSPSIIHEQAVKRVLRYLKGTIHFGICIYLKVH